MKYENPTIEVLYLEKSDIVTLSGEASGDNEGVIGPWS